ncbi:MAG: nuclear transport factor 2 family protein [Chloroflexi bacterium]|nr:nuclear transport factor 2 family protein [Chloroflexota bacterium]
MAEQENVALVQQAYAAFGRGDIAAVLQVFADDIEWVIPGPSDIPFNGTRRGKQAVGEWFGILGQNLDFQVFAPQEFIAQGDTVVVLVHSEGTIKRNSRKVMQDEAHVLTVRNGKVVRFQSFEDTAAVAAAWRGT